MISAARTPLAWLGALLAIYLIAPIVAFLVRLGHGAPAVPGLAGAVVTSLETATISTAIIAAAGVPLAYLLARARGRLGALLSILVALPLALPPLMSGILLLYLVGPYTFLGRLFGGNLTDSRAGIVIAQTFVAAPFLVVAARAAFHSIDPAYEEVAQTLGHGRLARFWKVALPIALPGVQAGLLLSWLRAFGEFGATVILAYHPYSLPVFTFVQFDATGLPSTMLAVAAALGAALAVLAAAALHARRPRLRATLPAPRAPLPGSPEPLDFAVAKRLGSFELAIEHRATGPRLALLGPSGAGKSLTLRILAGITDAARSEIHGSAAAPAALGPGSRRIGYLPQHSALLPRQTVWQQATFAVDADPALAAWWLDRLGLSGLENRFPHELSGGQQRRVALARALARSPSLVLLDEPFSALDAPVRSRLYRDLRRLQREAGLSTVLVTHDPEEAALLADDIIVLDNGRALQQGPAAGVFARPASTDVAALLGIPNTRAATVLRPGWIASHGAELAAPTGDLEPGTPVLWTIRPQDVRLDPAGPYAATVLDSVALVVSHEVTVALAGLELTIRTRRDPDLRIDASCRIGIPAEAMTLWPTQPAELDVTAVPA